MRLADRETQDAAVLEPTLRRARTGPRTLDSFQDPEFTWFYASMMGQMAAMNMQLVTRGLLAYDLTGSYAALGLVGLAGAVPMLLFSMFGGVLADATPKKTVLQAGQFCSLLNAAALAALVIANMMTMEWLVISAALQGLIMALMMPARQAMIPEVVGMDRLTNAIALNVAGMNGMRLVAPAVGGFIVSFLGYEWAFLAMSGLYTVALVSLAHVSWQPASSPGEVGASAGQVGMKALVDIREGFVYVFQNKLMLMLLGVSFVSSIFGMPYLFLLPGYVKDIFDGGGSEFGLLISISAIGSLLATLALASLPDRHRGLWFIFGMFCLGAGVALLAVVPSYWVCAAIMIPIGIGSALRQTLSQGLIQGYVEDAYRGRVLAVYMTQFSMMQAGTFAVGILAEMVGIRLAFAGLGLSLVAMTFFVLFFIPRMRRID